MSRYNDQLPKLVLPPVEHFQPAPVAQEAVRNYDRIEEELHLLQTKLTELRGQHAAAVEQDRAERALAVYHGKPDPGTKRSDKLATQIAAQEALVEPHANGLQDARRDVVETIKDGRAQLQTAAHARTAAAREEFLAAVDQLETAHRHVSDCVAFEGWLKLFPDRRPKWAPTASLARLDTLTNRGGSPHTFQEALEALRALTDPAKPVEPQQHVPPGRQQWGGRDPIAAQPSVATTVEMGVQS